MGSGFAAEVAQLEELSHKRKRDVDDHGDREQKKVHVEAIGPSIEDLHLDVGKKYLLCRTRKNSSFRDTSVLPFCFMRGRIPIHLLKHLANIKFHAQPTR